MSSEQFCGHTEPRSDQYALGVVVYELLSGRRVFEAEGPIALAYTHVHQAPDLDSSDRRIPLDLVRVVEKMLAKNPADRYPDIMEAVRHLQQSLAP